MPLNSRLSNGANRIVYLREPSKSKVFPWRKVLLRGGSAAILLFLAGGAIAVVRAPFFRVGEVRIFGAHSVSASAIEAVVREDLSGNRWLLVPRDNLLFVSAKHVEERLAHEFGSITNIRVDREFPKRLGVNVSERDLWGIACDHEPKPDAPSRCFYLDRNGTAYEEVSGVSGWLLPVIYMNGSVAEGADAVPPELMTLFDGSQTSLVRIPERLLSLTVATATPGDVRLRVAEGWEIWASLGDAPEDWGKTLATLLQQEIGDRKKNLNYVDLRFGRKVFYKYR